MNPVDRAFTLQVRYTRHVRRMCQKLKGNPCDQAILDALDRDPKAVKLRKEIAEAFAVVRWEL